MSNSFGFGGNNGVLIFSKAETKVQTRAPEKISLAVAGIGVVGPGAIGEKPVTAPLPPGKGLAHLCGPFDVSQLTPNQRRRSSRLQQMALTTARQSHAPDASQRVAVAIGTGLGCLEDAGAFIVNLIEKDEREPMPTRFPNSVHNSAAGQVAMDQGARSLNSAPTAGEITFECALWQAAAQLATDEADVALAGAVDEVDKYLVCIGQRWGAWSEKVLPGEGAAVASLARAEKVPLPLAKISALKLGRYKNPFAAKREAEWIVSAVDLKDVGVILTGAKGFARLEPKYESVAAELSALAGKNLEHQTYKQHCGEFHSASAFGFSQAIKIAREKNCGVLLYTLSLRGAKAVVVLWSKRSVASRWVRSEATLGDRNGRLVPAMIEPCERPVMFELTQTAELSHWTGAADDAAWLAFLSDVRRFVDPGAVGKRPAESAERDLG